MLLYLHVLLLLKLAHQMVCLNIIQRASNCVALKVTAVCRNPQNKAVTNPPIQGRRRREICHLCSDATSRWKKNQQ
jgi:hypothetical protein